MQFIKKGDKLMLILEGESCANCSDNILVPNTVDAANEKHIPVPTLENDVLTVNVGSVEHPMTPEHHIAWIYVETKDGGMFKRIQDSTKPIATFNVKGEEIVSVYEYCNLHGLWKKDM